MNEFTFTAPEGWEPCGESCWMRGIGGDAYAFLALEVLQETAGPSCLIIGDDVDVKHHAEMFRLSGKGPENFAKMMFARFRKDVSWKDHATVAKTNSLDTAKQVLELLMESRAAEEKGGGEK